MPPKRSSIGRKLPKANVMKEFRKKLNPDAKDELKKATREAVQKHRENWNEEKRIEIQEKDLKYKQNKR